MLVYYPLSYTIWLLLLETPHRQPKKPMSIWLSPNKSSRIPTSRRLRNTEKWKILCLSSSELELGTLQLLMMSLMLEFFKSVGETQESWKNHCRLKDSGWKSLKFFNENSQETVLLAWELQMRGPCERAWSDTSMQYTAPMIVITLKSDERNIPVLLLQHALFRDAKDIVVAGMASAPAPIIPGNHHS